MLRLVQIKTGDKLKQMLRSADAASLTRLQALNPHVDLAKVRAGSVLVLPDTPAFRDDQSDSVGADAWAALAADASAGLKARTEQLRSAAAARDAQRKEVQALLRSAAVKRQLDADTALRKQADAAEEQFKADQKAASDMAAQLDAMSRGLADEIAALGALLR